MFSRATRWRPWVSREPDMNDDLTELTNSKAKNIENPKLYIQQDNGIFGFTFLLSLYSALRKCNQGVTSFYIESALECINSHMYLQQ